MNPENKWKLALKYAKLLGTEKQSLEVVADYYYQMTTEEEFKSLIKNFGN